jgi:formate dehydrogenase subunit gamma
MNKPNELTAEATIQALINAHQDEPGALLPLLHAIQDALGYIPETSLVPIGKALNLSRAEVYGVVTYYHHFRQSPPAKHMLQVCRAEACQARGANRLIDQIEKKLGCKMHERTADGHIALEPIYCLGQCAVGPNILVDETTLHARVDSTVIDQVVSTLGDTQ